MSEPSDVQLPDNPRHVRGFRELGCGRPNEATNKQGKADYVHQEPFRLRGCSEPCPIGRLTATERLGFASSATDPNGPVIALGSLPETVQVARYYR